MTRIDCVLKIVCVMASLRETRVALLDAFSDDTIDEEEFVLLYDAQK